uniref:Uncharacterized protein n=1 Tax=Anopheles stephensi TaxID=30069 RepID=A0A182Y387_ANOST
MVPIIFDKFTVGRFDEGLIDPDMDSSDASLTSGGDLPGCPEGFMQCALAPSASMLPLLRIDAKTVTHRTNANTLQPVLG